jgi:hypothetical protein
MPNIIKILLILGALAALWYMTRKKDVRTPPPFDNNTINDRTSPTSPNPQPTPEADRDAPPLVTSRGPPTDSLPNVIHPVQRPSPAISTKTNETAPYTQPLPTAGPEEWPFVGFPPPLPTTTPRVRGSVTARYVFVERRTRVEWINISQIQVFRNGVRLRPQSTLCTNASGQFKNGDPADDCDSIADQLGIGIVHADPLSDATRVQRIGIDLGRDREIDYIHVRNRATTRSVDRIAGCAIVARSANGMVVYEYTPTTVALEYFLPMV